MKKTVIAVFIIICFIPLVVMSAVPGIDKNYENRPLSRFPARFDKTFPEAFQNYFTDNFGLRSAFISTASVIASKLFTDTLNKKVILGKDGWLFFDQTVDDYLGRDSLTDLEVKRLSRILAVMSKYLHSRGIDFYFMPVPNKNSIYPQYMPKRYSKARLSSPSALIRLTDELIKDGTGIIDLLSEFKTGSDKIPLYHRKDTHWNTKGAYIASTMILNQLDMPYTSVEDASFHIQKDHYGDLQKMLTPAFRILDDQIYIDRILDYSYLSNFRTFDDPVIITQAEGCAKTLLMYRDSFANSLIPLLSGHFSNAYYYRHFPFDHSLIDEHQPGVVIAQIAERSLRDLLTTPPVYPSVPESLEMTGVHLAKTDDALFEIVRKSGYYELTGTSATIDASRVYFAYSSLKSVSYFEAMVMKSEDTDIIHFRTIIEDEYIDEENMLFSIWFTH